MAVVTAIGVTAGSGTNIAGYSFTDTDSVSKVLQRITLSDDTGAEKAVLANPLFATLTPNTTGGWSCYTNADTALSSTKEQVKSSQGLLGGYIIYNPNASVIYIPVWFLPSASVTVGTTAPDMTIPLAAGATANVEFANGVDKAGGGTGITVAATTTEGGSTAPGTALPFTILYN